MALPGSILFPGAIIPLHIFENRYRRMLTDSLNSHRLFCIGTMRENCTPEESIEVYSILGIGLIRVAVDKSDGSSDIIVQGVCRARILNFVDGKPYPRAHVELLSTTSPSNGKVTIEHLTEKVAQLAMQRGKLDRSISEKTLKYLTALRDPGALSDLVSFSMLDDWHDQQTILETLNIENRLQKLIALLQKEIERHKTINDLQKKIKKKKIDLN